jgi:cytochrome c oxidase accessory protein FixG
MLGFTGVREWVYPSSVRGRFMQLHTWTSAALFAILFIGPWLRWNGQPLFLADLPARRLHVLGMIFTPSDGVLLMLGALTAAFSLFLFTALLGRVWCGYACPQSVFLINLVLPVEQFFEGERGQRRNRDKRGEGFDVAWRKVAKWTTYLAMAAFISMSFMGFFVPTETLWTGGAGVGAYGVVAFFTALWFWDFAWYREQTCNFICPYARFQGALTDDESLVIAYDALRGDPRGRAAKERGGCIDCKKCVTVCPQGIDIRDGFQLECIACGRCIDACTSVMDRLGHPTLVRYTTGVADEGGKPRVVRPRTLAYTALLTVLLSVTAGVLYTHESVEVLVDRAPGSVFVEDDDGFVRNSYLVHLADRDNDPETQVFAVAVEGLPEGSQVRARPAILEDGERITVPVIVRIPTEAAAPTIPLTVVVRGAEEAFTRPTTFTGPGARGS